MQADVNASPASPAIHDERYREMLTRLICRQLMAEYRAMLVYTRAVELAPSWDTKALIAGIGSEEGRHTVLLAHLAEGLGIEPQAYLDEYFNKHPIEYHTSWLQVVARLFLGDRAAVYQLTSYKGNSYAPWAAALESIIEDEAGDGGHMDRGEALVASVCADPAAKEEFQGILNHMLPYGLRLLGNPENTAENDYCLQVGLKTKSSGQVQEDYVFQLAKTMKFRGLKLPDLSAVRLTPANRQLVAAYTKP